MKIIKALLAIVVGALTILAGAVPATYLCLMAYVVLVLGYGAVLSGDALGLVLILWALAGFYGTLSLWAVGFGFVRPWSVTGLILGTVALLPMGGPVLTGTESRGLDGNPDEMMFVTPILVAVAWLIVLMVRAFALAIADTLEATRG